MEQISGKKENILLDVGDMVTLKDLQVDYSSSKKKLGSYDHGKENKSPILSPGMTEKSNRLHLELQKLQSKIMGLEEKLNEPSLRGLTDRKKEEASKKVSDNMNVLAKDHSRAALKEISVTKSNHIQN